MTVSTELSETIPPAVAFTTVFRSATKPEASRSWLTKKSLRWIPTVR
jgi:hypothetical protein